MNRLSGRPTSRACTNFGHVVVWLTGADGEIYFLATRRGRDEKPGHSVTIQLALVVTDSRSIVCSQAVAMSDATDVVATSDSSDVVDVTGPSECMHPAGPLLDE